MKLQTRQGYGFSNSLVIFFERFKPYRNIYKKKNGLFVTSATFCVSDDKWTVWSFDSAVTSKIDTRFVLFYIHTSPPHPLCSCHSRIIMHLSGLAQCFQKTAGVGERDWDTFVVCKPRPCVVKTSFCSQMHSTDLDGGRAPLCVLCLLLLNKAHIKIII